VVSGVCPVLAVPFTENGGVDYNSFTSLVEWIISLGIENVLMFGIASENIKLDDVERDRLLQTLIAARGKSDLKVIASVADHSSELAVNRAQKYQGFGADYINILPPTFFSPSQEQVLFHISEVLGSVTLPVIVQHLPQAGGDDDISPIVKLASAHSNLAMIKCEANPPTQSIEMVEKLSGGRIKSLVGWGGLSWLDGARAGSIGVQPGCSLTDLYVWAGEALKRGDYPEFESRLEKFLPIVRNWISNIELLIAAEKRMLMQRGIIATDYCRNPTVRIPDQVNREINQFLSLLDSQDLAVFHG